MAEDTLEHAAPSLAAFKEQHLVLVVSAPVRLREVGVAAVAEVNLAGGLDL